MGARNIGAVVKRLEDPRLLTGRGRYTDDIVVAGMLEWPLYDRAKRMRGYCRST